MTMEDDIKIWTAKRKAALVMEIIYGRTSISEASCAFDVSSAEIEEWVDGNPPLFCKGRISRNVTQPLPVAAQM